MKYLFPLFTLLCTASGLQAQDMNCLDMWGKEWNITQKIDDHHYEMVDPGVLNSIHVILHTKRAIFNKPGHPYGIKALRGGTQAVALKNGFTMNIGVFTECGIIPIHGEPERNPFLTVRQRLKGDDFKERH